MAVKECRKVGRGGGVSGGSHILRLEYEKDRPRLNYVSLGEIS
jgi:hypothetical protein